MTGRRTLLSPSLADLVRGFAGTSVAVLGDAILDEWIEGRAAAMAREAPVPTVDVRTHRGVPGGAANVAANVAALGGTSRLITVLGRDAAGDRLRRLLRQAGVDTSMCLAHPWRTTRVKQRVVADGQVVARFDEGDTSEVSPDTDRLLAGLIHSAARMADVLLVADYGSGVLRGPAVHEAVRDSAHQVLVLVDAHDVSLWQGAEPGVVTPNWAELCRLMGHVGALAWPPTGRERSTWVMSHGAQVLRAAGTARALVTLDEDGAVVLQANAPAQHVPALPVRRPHPAGAGDTVAAALGLALAGGADLIAASELAMAAASVSVARSGTATCRGGDLLIGQAVVGTPVTVIEAVLAERRLGRRIVLTNGCFDMLHAGHVELLEAAAQQGDVLVVALNEDEGVRRIKGPGRPVNSFDDRARLLAALGCVDHIVGYASEAPLHLVEAIRPDVYVKGADHEVEQLPEARLTRQLGGQVLTVPLLPDRSTQGVIEACSQIPVRA